MTVKIMMVCLGNICRSPMAEGLMAEKIASYRLDASVDSSGFESFHLNDPPDDRAIKVMKRHGIDISGHRMRLFHTSDFDNYDRIFVMDQHNFRDVVSLSRDENDIAKVDMILNTVEPGRNRSVPDPYYGGESGFEQVFRLLDEATEKIAQEIKSSRDE